MALNSCMFHICFTSVAVLCIEVHKQSQHLVVSHHLLVLSLSDPCGFLVSSARYVVFQSSLSRCSLFEIGNMSMFMVSFGVLLCVVSSFQRRLFRNVGGDSCPCLFLLQNTHSILLLLVSFLGTS
jgi:hypothetical protein